MKSKDLLFALTGTSGSGKTTLCIRLLKNFPSIARVITTTTRPPRHGEINGVDYYFSTQEDFSKSIEKNAYLEYSKVYNHYYGVSKKSIEQSNSVGKDLVLCVDVHGAQTLKQHFNATQSARRLICIFVSPSSLTELENRLISRGTDDVWTIQKRLQTAEKELATLPQFDYYLRSQDKESDWQALQHIYFAEKMRI
ncbi:MAG: guanylate kinase [Puniceicoccales bacterium]|jgi:guanylate kinase|nr:guanylate kinase [Puniceicoccales bacterium]